MSDELQQPVANGKHVSFGPIEIYIGNVGDARIKRLTYPPGMVWSSDIKPLVDTALCEHSHAGYLAQGALGFSFPDGFVQEFAAPAFVEVAHGHDAYVIGDQHAVLVEVDFEEATAERLGMPDEHPDE